MCHACYRGYGAHTAIAPEIVAAAKAVEALYEVHLAGGFLHIVTDDFNIEDCHVESVGESIANPEAWWGREPDEVEREAHRLLAALDVKGRATALAVWEGWVPAGDEANYFDANGQPVHVSRGPKP